MGPLKTQVKNVLLIINFPFVVIACGVLQALKVAGVHPIMAKRGGQTHPPPSSPLNIFMYQVGFLISSQHRS